MILFHEKPNSLLYNSVSNFIFLESSKKQYSDSIYSLFMKHDISWQRSKTSPLPYQVDNTTKFVLHKTNGKLNMKAR